MAVNPALPFFSREKDQGNEEERKNRNNLILQGDKQLKGNKTAVTVTKEELGPASV